MHTPRISWTATCLFVAMLTATLAIAQPAPIENQTALFVLDASGSMWGRINGQPKIEIAKGVLHKTLTDLPENLSVGIMVYGHRRKGDCNDIELLVPPGAPQGTTMTSAVDKIQPKGMTPISQALVHAAQTLKYTENAGNIILISDGIETCQGDPCSVAKELRQEGINLKIFVVGFDVSASEATNLQCIAHEGGGHYFTAASAQSLSEALATIQAHVAHHEPLPQAEPTQPAPIAPQVDTQGAASTRVKVNAVATIKLQTAPWVRLPKAWSIVDAESGKKIGVGQGDTIRVTPGVYQFSWQQSEHESQNTILNTTIIAKTGATTTVSLDTGIRLTGPKELGNAYYWLLKDDMDNVVARFSGKETYLPQLVPAGRHTLLWRSDEHGTDETNLGEIVISTGQLLEKILDTGIVLALPEWLPAPYQAILQDNSGIQYKFGKIGIHPLKPGQYTLLWRQSEHNHSMISFGSVQVEPGSFSPLPVTSGLTFVAGNQKPPYRIIATNITSGITAEMRESWGPMPLPPGAYSLDMQESQHGGSLIRLIEDLQVGQGQLLELEL